MGCGAPLALATGAGGVAGVEVVVPCPASAPLQAVKNKDSARALIFVSVRNVLFIPNPFSCAAADVVAVRFVAHDFDDSALGFLGEGVEDAGALFGGETGHFLNALAFFAEDFFEAVHFGGDAGVEAELDGGGLELLEIVVAGAAEFVVAFFAQILANFLFVFGAGLLVFSAGFVSGG